MGALLRFSVAISCLCLLSLAAGVASLPPRESLGIPPNDLSYYKANVIKCKDGSKKFTKEQLNDDFCDCADGTDEPGTNACPEGKFYCANTGHIPLTLFSSRVNDGICDCCDGSDEYNSGAQCPNTCWEAGKEARDKLKKKIETHQEGLSIRKKEVEKAKEAFAKEEAELTKLKSEEKVLKGLVEKLREHKERIEKAEEEERLRKEKEEKALKDSQNSTTEEQEPPEESPSESDEFPSDSDEFPSDDLHDFEDQSPPSSQVSDGHVGTSEANHDLEETSDEVSSHSAEHVLKDEDRTTHEASISDKSGEEAPLQDETTKEQVPEDTEGLSREELGRLVASRWTGERSSQKENELNDPAVVHDDQHNPDNIAEEHHGGYNSGIDDDRNKFEDEDFEDDTDEEYGENHDATDASYNSDEEYKSEFSDLTPTGSPTWLEKIKQSVQNILEAFNVFKSPVDISEASRVRKEYEDANSKLSKLQSRISSLTDKHKHDFGKDKEFYSFYGQCFEIKENKYVYKVCPFKSATQVEGYSTTQLGRWEKFDESYRVMEFANGDRCWNGPDRSLKVRLRCGLKDELADIDEPSRCEYKAILSTPILCLEEKLKELQQKLENLTKVQPSSHDEL